jgi:hypothetical protein
LVHTSPLAGAQHIFQGRIRPTAPARSPAFFRLLTLCFLYKFVSRTNYHVWVRQLFHTCLHAGALHIFQGRIRPTAPACSPAFFRLLTLSFLSKIVSRAKNHVWVRQLFHTCFHAGAQHIFQGRIRPAAPAKSPAFLRLLTLCFFPKFVSPANNSNIHQTSVFSSWDKILSTNLVKL